MGGIIVTSASVRRSLGFVILGLALTLGLAQEARAQGFISPFIGFNFAGDSGCPEVTNCEDKRLNWGVSLGAMNAIIGFEEEFAYASDFFGSVPGGSSSVLTLMSNLMVGPKIAIVRPYGVVGVGLIKTHAELNPTSLLSATDNNFGWDIGGGIMVTVAPHVGVRGDIRYFHAFQELNLAGIELQNTKLDFGRASAALVITF